MKKFFWVMGFVALLILSQLSPAGALTVSLEPAAVTLPEAGVKFGINVLIEDVQDLGGFQFDINYDPAIVTIQSDAAVVLGPFLASSGNSASPLGPSIDNVGGKVSFGGFSFGGKAGPNGTGILASIEFTVQSQTVGELNPSNVEILDTHATTLPITGVSGCTLTVLTQPPIADFIGTPVSGKAPLLVSFTDASTGEITSRSWDFGDGTSSTVANPQHTYNVPGTYTVALTVEGPGGEDTKERMNYIVVSSQSSTSLLYFPHIASVGDWETEIGIINDSDTYLNGVLNVYDHSGEIVSSGKPITLGPHERMQFDVSYVFTNHNSIAYAILQADTDKAKGYVKFCLKGNDRVAIPAVRRINTGVIYIPHIASTVDWWTGIALVNTASSSKDISITFDRGDIIPMTLDPYEHRAFTISQLFNGQEQPTIHSAIIEDAGGVIGLEIYGGHNGNNQVEGILLSDSSERRIYYPHLASDTIWWTGIVACNPSSSPAYLTITPYRADGVALSSKTLTLAGRQKYIGYSSELGFPKGTAWFQIEANRPMTGFELFGTRDGKQLAGYSGMNASQNEGVFAKIERYGWTGIAFVNTEGDTAVVELTAYADDGNPVAVKTLELAAHAKIAHQVEDIFAGYYIEDASYVAYSSAYNIVGFQLNGSTDGTMLDGLPGM